MPGMSHRRVTATRDLRSRLLAPAAVASLVIVVAAGCKGSDAAKLARGCVAMSSPNAVSKCKAQEFDCVYYTGKGDGKYVKPMREYGSTEEAVRQAELDGCTVGEKNEWNVRACCAQTLPSELFP